MSFRRRCLAVFLTLAASALHAQVSPLQNLTAITAGGFPANAHSCALDAAGNAYCWGSNASGQLGDGSFNRRTVATRILGQPEPFKAISAGSAHTCALGNSGAVHCWGANLQVDPSTQTLARAAMPVRVQLAGAVRSLSTAGSTHGCAVLESGAVACWGSNGLGQLGGGDLQTRLVEPVDLPASALQVVTDVAHSCALLVGGSVYCWGQNNAGQTGQPASSTPVARPTAVAAIPGGAVSLGLGNFASCVVNAAGAVYCWGSYTSTAAASANPTAVAGLQSGVTRVSLGGYGHLCASLAAGGMRCLGLNFVGQLGRGAVSLTESVGPVFGITERVDSFEAGFFHVCAVVAGQALCWGEDIYGQLGRNDDALATAPGPVRGLPRRAVRVDGGGDHGCAVDDAGRAHCWGSNFAGQLGDGTTVTRADSAPVAAPGIVFSAIALGSTHSCAAEAGGGVQCWGSNYSGQLGNGGTNSSSLPVAVAALQGVSSLSAGLFHTCAVAAGGTVKCWGDNSVGELGDGTTQPRLAPVDVQGLPGPATAVAAAFGHSCALISGGAVWCWGSNFFGTLGRVTSGTVAVPPGPVEGLTTGVSQIAAGYGLSCALLGADRSVRCWGTGHGVTPRPVEGLSAEVVSLAADGGNRISGSQQQVCGILADGHVRCAGSNKFGQLGDGTTVARVRAERVGGVQGATVLGVGEHHACAIGAEGAVACWGGNAVGQLGQGSFGLAPAPVVVVTDTSLAQLQPASEAADGTSRTPLQDAFGRYLVFESEASNLVPGDTNAARDVFRRDRASGAIAQVSVDDAERPIAGDSIEPSFSADGELIVFVAPDAAVGAVAAETRKAAEQRRAAGLFAVFLRNMVTGTTQRLATALPGGTGTSPHLAPLAGAVAFTALPTSPEQVTTGQPNVFVVPLRREGDRYLPGTPTCPTCKRGSTQPSDGPSREGVLSADAEWLAFTSQATQFQGVPVPCPQASSHVYLRNLLTAQIQRLGAPASPQQCSPLGASRPSIDWSGQHVAFETGVALDEDDRNGFSDVYLFDASSGRHERISEDPRTGHDGLDASTAARISGDGNVVAFQSSAKNLDSSEPDDNETNDILVRNLVTRAMRRVSRNSRGDQGNAPSEGAALNWNGTSVAFASLANNLSLSQRLGRSTDANGVQDVFLAANPLVPADKTGTWWIPAESGWGIFTVDQGNVLGVGWFTYDSDGEPTWFVGAATEQPDGRYVGEMFRTTGVPLAEISGLATETSVKFADITLRFTGTSVLQFDYAVVGGASRAKRMSRFIYNGEDIVCHPSPFASRKLASNASDLWWGGAHTSGWGIFLNQAHDVLVSSWYTYDTDHEAVFLTAVAARQPDGRFTGLIYRQANGTPYDQIDNRPPSASATVVGSVSIQLLDGETADFTYALGSTTQTKRIGRYAFGTRPAACAEARP